jgi:hypothetical protein
MASWDGSEQQDPWWVSNPAGALATGPGLEMAGVQPPRPSAPEDRLPAEC